MGASLEAWMSTARTRLTPAASEASRTAFEKGGHRGRHWSSGCRGLIPEAI